RRGAAGPAMGDGQLADRDVGRTAADAEDAAGVAAAEGQAIGTCAVDGQVIGDAQLAAGQGDGAVTGYRGEADQVSAGVDVGVEDRLAQRAEATVREVFDREDGGHSSVLQELQPWREVQSSAPFRAAPSIAPGALVTRFQAAKQRG